MSNRLSLLLKLPLAIFFLFFLTCSGGSGVDREQKTEQNEQESTDQTSEPDSGSTVSKPDLNSSINSRFFQEEASQIPLRTVWSYPAHGRVGADPAVFGGTVYGSSYDFTLYALSAGAERPRWTFRTGGVILAPPVKRNNLIYFGSADGSYYAVSDLNGELLWQFPTRGFPASSSVITDSAVFTGTTFGTVYALSVQQGEPVWEVTSGDGITAGPVMVSGNLITGSVSGTIRGYDAESGAELFAVENGDVPVTGMIRAGSRICAVWFDGRTALLDGNTGEFLWEQKFQERTAVLPVFGLNRIIFSSERSIRSLNANDGAIIWKRQLEAPAVGSVLLSDGYIYASLRDGKILCLRMSDGTVLWETAIPGIPSTAPVPAGELVYVGTESGAFLCLGPEEYELPESGSESGTPVLTTKEADLPIGLSPEGTEVRFIPPETGTYLISFPAQEETPVILQIKDSSRNTLSSTMDKLGLDADISFRFVQGEEYILSIEPLRDEQAKQTIRLSIRFLM